ncbi:endonuclease/exonuclease/phosphatase family protein [Parenemella sanctibonifatiensis]|uniref:Endonuclease/exonuclease/phosphatase n=1 Tax=Parenemella sanctibonifatiensis TaxID=2016505 RepID=A0A255ECY5_9ACTN|nr:endonuclease/exonuclease/phosphatase family protein [Parenemella sanctibonifatiensis]OYN89414.1 endonuclease/exonuclease/phosphatase [Parenemella sanctibonifatiensis]
MLRKIAVIIAAAALALTALAAPANADPRPREREVRVMSYNIHHAQGVDGVLSLDRIAAEITRADADVIGLQEVDNHWERSDFADQAQELADRLGMHVVFGANLDLPPAEGQTHNQQYGTAILSRYPIVRSENTLLTSIDYPERPTEQRGLLTATINIRGVRLEVHNTHYDHQRAEQRDLSVTETLEIFERNDRPAVLLGDLNAEPDSAEIQRLTTVLDDAFAGRDDANTLPSELPTKRIDYILGRDVSFSDAEVGTTLASDHLPVAATITFSARPGA